MMGISALDVFEELRFIWELLLAEILFAACFTKKRKTGKWLLPVGWLVFSLSAGIYVTYVLDLAKQVSGIWINAVNILWYVLLSAGTIPYIYYSFDLPCSCAREPTVCSTLNMSSSMK